MRKIIYATIFLTILILLNTLSAIFQSSLGKVYHVASPDGRVFIVGENHGVVPFTASLHVNLRHMSSNVPLRSEMIVVPTEKPLILAILTPEPYSFPSYNYHWRYQLGALTSHQPDTSYTYRLPYSTRASEVMPVRTKEPHIYAFQLPENTPICAARAGVVAYVEQASKVNKHISNNAAIIMHDDGSYAFYNNIKQQSALVKIGHRVAAGDTISYFGGNKYNHSLFFAVQYPADSIPKQVPVLFQVGSKIIRP